MIIVIGKKDKALLRDAVAYIFQCGKKFYFDGITKNEEAKVLDNDCQKIANRLLKAVGEKFHH